jgi:hypothetical protein
MTIKTITKEVFETEDGNIFDTKEKAEQHTQKLKDLKYYLVTWGADLTEGRCWGDYKSYIAVNTNGSHYEFAEILCFSKFGSPNQFCQGVFGNNAIMPYWRLNPTQVSELNPSIKVDFAVEDRFVGNKIYSEGLWDLRDKDGKKKIQFR